MIDKFQNKFRISSARMQNWNYRSNAAYFVTICTQNRNHFFGEIVESIADRSLGTPGNDYRDASMASLRMTDIGKIVETEWLKTPQLRPDMNIELGAFVVMPNHFHGIVIIGENKYNFSETGNHFGPQSKNLASIIRGFKSSVTSQSKNCEKNNFAWQPRFHDVIIRNARSFERIQNYIINNPKNWKKDRFRKIIPVNQFLTF